MQSGMVAVNGKGHWINRATALWTFLKQQGCSMMGMRLFVGFFTLNSLLKLFLCLA